MDLNDYAILCHRANEKWWHDPKTDRLLERNLGEMLMLCVSELAEALEGHRKGLQDDHLPHRKMLEVELADCLIRIFDMAGALSADGEYVWGAASYPNPPVMDIEGAFREKMAYNATRKDHTHEARLQPGGKKY